MHPQHQEYYRFTTKSRLDTSINSLLGILEGITYDRSVSETEARLLISWLSEHSELRSRHPFDELVPVLETVLSDGILTEEERLDLVYLCDNLLSTEFYDFTTADIQRLHGIMAGIAADGRITEHELSNLAEWMKANDHLRRCWPYDEMESLITSVMADKKIDEAEHRQLLSFCSDFLAVGNKRIVSVPTLMQEKTVQGVCAMCPEISFKDSVFCFTGASKRYTRKSFTEMILDLGGKVSDTVVIDLNYLVIGADGNPCWSYSCYGRKVERAVELRKQGRKLLLVHEHDFTDAVTDALGN